MAVQVEDHIARLGKKGLRPSAIGVILRDQHGIAQVRLCVIGWRVRQVAACCVKALLASAPTTTQVIGAWPHILLRASFCESSLFKTKRVRQVAAVTTSKILRIMKKLGMAPEIPEDLYHLIKKAVSMRKHLEANRKDRDGKFRLILVESRIHRLARYYKARQPLAWLCSEFVCVSICCSY